MSTTPNKRMSINKSTDTEGEIRPHRASRASAVQEEDNSNVKTQPRTCGDIASLVAFCVLCALAFLALLTALILGALWLQELHNKGLDDCGLPKTVGVVATVFGVLGIAALVVLLVLLFLCCARARGMPFGSLRSVTEDPLLSRRSSNGNPIDANCPINAKSGNYNDIPERNNQNLMSNDAPAEKQQTCRSKLCYHCGMCGRTCVYILIPLFLFCLGLALCIMAGWMLSLSLQVPSLQEDFSSVKGLSGNVEIKRDEFGFPHIRAETHCDALFGQGLATAQDRLWQIEFQRLVGAGKLSHYVGSAGIKVDKQTRTLNFRKAAEALLAGATQEDKELLQCYSNGINFYLDHYDQRPPEFAFMSRRMLFFHQPEPFTPLDITMTACLMQWNLGTNLRDEIERFKVFMGTERSYDEVLELYVNQTNISNTILTAEEMNLTEDDAVAARKREARDFELERQMYDGPIAAMRAKHQKKTNNLKQEVDQRPQKTVHGNNDNNNTTVEEWDLLEMMEQQASNAWAARGASHSVGASDPHLGINLPSVWYYAHLSYRIDPSNPSSEYFDTIGVGLPGIPGVHIGKTNYVSWGITMSMMDIQDLYIITPDPNRPDTHYMVNGTSIAYELRDETISPLRGKEFTMTVKDTIYGPVVTEVLELPEGAGPIALWAQSLQNDSTSVTAILNFGRPTVRTALDLREKVLEKIRAPTFSIPITDKDASLVYGLTGFLPQRAPGHTGMFPTMGNGTFTLIQEAIPYAELPALSVPPNGKARSISTANQKVYPDGYKYSLGYDYAYPYRGGRLHQLLLGASPDKLGDIAFHKTVQTDVQSNIAVKLLDILNDDSTYPEAKVFKEGLDEKGKQWFTHFVDKWNKKASLGDTTTAVFWSWLLELYASPTDAIKAIENKNPKKYWSAGQGADVQRQITNPTALQTKYCKARRSASSCGALFATLLNDIVAGLPLPTASHKDMTRWGVDTSRLYLKHLMAHGTPIGCMFERRADKDGDFSSVNVAKANLEKMEVTHASSMRQLYDWSHPHYVITAFPGGASGNPFSKYYTNMLHRYSEDEYVLVWSNASDALANVTASQTLSP